jgi:dephospho-CoA kinase
MPGNPKSEFRNPKLVLGLLGGIGSGKSAVAAAFARHGARVIDADKLGHDALRDPAVRRRIAERWGAGLLDENGAVVRSRLAEIVFASDEERKALETIVHPWIGNRIREEIASAQADPAVRFILLDAAIMLEAGWHAMCESLIFVDSPREERLERIARQRGWTPEQVAMRERAQMPLTAKAARADHVVNNSGSLEHLEHQVDSLLSQLGLKESKKTD